MRLEKLQKDLLGINIVRFVFEFESVNFMIDRNRASYNAINEEAMSREETRGDDLTKLTPRIPLEQGVAEESDM